MELYVILAVSLVAVIALYIRERRQPKIQTKKEEPVERIVPHITTQVVDLSPLIHSINDLPTKILQSITSSSNTHKGALGELIGYINLRASYDRIVPLGNIVDFMAIKFPKGDEPGHVDFIDIKTGDKSRLSKDQRELQKLIEEKRINFLKLKVETQSSEDPT